MIQNSNSWVKTKHVFSCKFLNCWTIIPIRTNLEIGPTQNWKFLKFDLTSLFHIFNWLKNMPYLNFTFKNDRIMCTWFYCLLRPPSLRIWKINRNRSSSINIYLKDKLILTVKDWNSIPWITIPKTSWFFR